MNAIGDLLLIGRPSEFGGKPGKKPLTDLKMPEQGVGVDLGIIAESGAGGQPGLQVAVRK